MIEDQEDTCSKARLEKCRGCENLVKKIQERKWENDGVTLRKEKKSVLHWWCQEFKLHLNFIDRLDACNQNKECPHFRN